MNLYNYVMTQMRLFIALSLPDRPRLLLHQSWAKLLPSQSQMRPVKSADLHVTVKFLGGTPLEDLPLLTEALEELAAKLAVPKIHFIHGLVLPPHRPRTIVMDIENNTELQLIFDAVDNELAARNLSNRETRLFNPHVTVARVKGDLTQLTARTVENWAPAIADFDPVGLTLFESKLEASGAHYTPLVSYPLS